MFGHMKAHPILTENAQPVRWIEFSYAILLLATVQGDPGSGALYVFDRKSGTWFWIDFDDQQYGGYSVSDFELLIHEYDILSLVERPDLLKATPGWILEPGKPAEMATPSK